MTQNLKKLKKKLTDHSHDKYITTPEFNKQTAENCTARLAQTGLVTKTDFENKLSSLNRKITANKTKHLVVENELKKLKAFDSSYFVAKDILKMMAHKFGQYFNQYKGILKQLG